jgi:hypothetical protein
MLRIFFACFLLIAGGQSTFAQDYRKKSEAYLEAQSAVLQARQQQRRDMLREAVKVQVDEASVPARQMTAQEKAELRQQLREQRQENVK